MADRFFEGWHIRQPIGQLGRDGKVYLSEPFRLYIASLDGAANQGAEINGGFGFVYGISQRAPETAIMAGFSERRPAQSSAASGRRENRRLSPKFATRAATSRPVGFSTR